MTIASSVKTTTAEHDRHYASLLEAVSMNFKQHTKDSSVVLYQTEAEGLFDVFLNNLPDDRQSHTCNCCRQFFQRFGNLVTIDKTGRLRSVMFGDVQELASDFYFDALAAVAKRVVNSRIKDVFVTKEKKWGTPVTGEWKHVSVTPPVEHIYVDRYGIKPVEKVQAEYRVNCAVLTSSLLEFSLDTIDKAIALVKSDALYRGQKFLAELQWFRDLREQAAKAKTPARKDALIWAAVGTAPTGFTNVRSNMTGTLLEDIQNGMSLKDVKARFDAKMDPTKYNRPQTLPGAGNVAQGEKLIAAMGLKPALSRRFARLNELRNIWTPKIAREIETDSAFAAFALVPTKGVKKNELFVIGDSVGTGVPVRTMTFVKFATEVLPNVDEMSLFVADKMNFGAYVTAANADAPPLILWDTEEFRNPMTWYVYKDGSTPAHWNLTTGEWHMVTAISPQPSRWNPTNAHKMDSQGDGLLFVLYDCKDTNYHSCGLGLFPEYLRSELREVRKTIEAFSQQNVLQGYGAASACGIRVTSNQPFGNLRIRVRSKNVVSTICLDRWD